MMTRVAQYDRKYGIAGALVRKSIARVAAAGRSGDPTRIERARARHRALMASLY